MTATTAQVPAGSDALLAEQAWRDGHGLAAIEAADRALAAGTDPGGRAAAVAAAGAAADGGLLDAAARWRGVAGTLDGAAASRAHGRAALAAGLAGDVTAALADLGQARDRMPDPAPRGLTVLLGGAGAVVEAVDGRFDRASRHLASLATAAVAPDPLCAERWDELAVTVAAAGGDVAGARAALAGRAEPPTSRGRLLTAWLDLRSGQPAEARAGLAAVAQRPVLRRDALLGAAVTVGLARRSGDTQAMAASWHRVAPVAAGADVEVLLLDVWGELSVVAERVSPGERDVVVDAMDSAVARAGSPWWAVGTALWWGLERTVVTGDAVAAADVAHQLATLATAHPRLRGRAEAAAVRAAVLTGRTCAESVQATATRLAATGMRWEAQELCRAAAERIGDPAAARRLLGAGRGLGTASGSAARPGASGLSDREREVGALVVDGLTHREIGARLYISPKTVEQHVARLRQKLEASSRATLVVALRARLET